MWLLTHAGIKINPFGEKGLLILICPFFREDLQFCWTRVQGCMGFGPEFVIWYYLIGSIFKSNFLNKNYWLSNNIHLNLFLMVQLTICKHWFRWWLGAKEATSHYLIQWRPSSLAHICLTRPQWVNTLRPRQNGRHFADDMFKCIFLNENVWIPIKIPKRFVPKGPINNIQVLVQIMAWRRPGDKPLSEPMMDISKTHICLTRPQWVNAQNCLLWTHAMGRVIIGSGNGPSPPFGC